jgi:hypothetical protein
LCNIDLKIAGLGIKVYMVILCETLDFAGMDVDVQQRPLLPLSSPEFLVPGAG